MPLVAVPSVKVGVTVSPRGTALSSVSVNIIRSPSVAEASLTVTDGGPSLSTIVPVAVATCVPDVWSSLTVKVSFSSSSLSPIVATVKVFVSPAVPAKVTLAFTR